MPILIAIAMSSAAGVLAIITYTKLTLSAQLSAFAQMAGLLTENVDSGGEATFVAAQIGFSGSGGLIAAGLGVIVLTSLVVYAIMTSRRLTGSSLFNRLFIVVASASAFFSGISSAIGFGLITSQETEDIFRNAVLPPAFGVFVFFLATTIWIGGAEFVRNRDWFRRIKDGVIADAAFFIERALKLFVIIPIFAVILFLVSTWTTVVGIGGVDAVRHTYNYELSRLQAECAGITAHRQKDYLFLEDLRLSVADVSRVAQNEALLGTQTGTAGRGAVADYFSGVADWLAGLENAIRDVIESEHPSGAAPYQASICTLKASALRDKLASNAFENYDLWARDLETEYNDFITVLNRWRRDRRLERLLETQLDGFARANPVPFRASGNQLEAINQYADQVTGALESLLRSQKLAKPPPPTPSAQELSPERGLAIFTAWRKPDALVIPNADAKLSRTARVVYEEEKVEPLSTISPRDAVLKNANIFSDIWALAFAWDFASYILMLAYLFFPSAERAAGFKDE